MKTVVGLGEVLWDMLPKGKQLGGAPINFAYHASLLGHQGYAVSAVGNDNLGRLIVNQLEKKGVKPITPATDYPTGMVQISVDAEGIPQYDICQGVAWDYIPFTPQMKQLATYTDAVCFGSLAQRNAISRSTIQQFLQAMPKHEEVLKIFDVNLRQHYYDKEVLQESLALSNVLKINDEELPIVSDLLAVEGCDAEAQCYDLIRKYALRMVIFTCGAKGSFVFAPDVISHAETPRVEVVDTVGAGDSFAGAFAGSLLNGKSVREAHQVAVRVSAYVCTQQGAMPDVPIAFF